MVYSTCSVAVEENEAVVAYAMRNRHVRIEEFALDDGSTDVGRPVRFPPVYLFSREHHHLKACRETPLRVSA
jgi:16S rRNA C967 or C1407 C5-methylase (RsmB/RsmF family)